MSNVWLDAPRPDAVARACVTSSADVREIERTPYAELLPAWSILGVLEYTASLAPSKPAFVVADRADPTRTARSISYAELTSSVRATANRLRVVSGSSRPVVSILTPLVPEAFIASWAGATAGVANPINPFLRVDHVAEIMNAARTTVLVCGTSAYGPGAWDEVSELRERVPTLRAVWFTDDAAGADSFRRQIELADQDRLAYEPLRDPDGTAALLHTGGTTAAPKLVRLTERAQLLNAWCCGAWNGSRAEEVVAVGAPYFHVTGATVLALAGIVFGQTMVIVGPGGYRDPRVIAGYWDFVEAHGVTLTCSAPTTAAALVTAHSRRTAPAGFSYLAGGSAVPIQIAREFADKFGVALREGWGMTELHGALIGNPRGAAPRLGSIGIAFPYHRIRCVELGSTTADDEVPGGGTGVLAVSGPCVTPGYLDKARTADLFFHPDTPGERWLNTGDLCSIDRDGYVWLRGRSKDLIIRGGHNIDPLVIEEALIVHPAVMYAAAIGEPDREKGELPVAYVQLRPGMSVSEAELMAHCRQEITERAAVPRALRIVEAMPITAVGKIFKPALRFDAVRRCVDSVLAQQGADDVEVEVRETAGVVSVILKLPHPAMERVVENMRRELEHYTFRVEIESAAPR
jgi:fatty-acyl-CoA synthase